MTVEHAHRQLVRGRRVGGRRVGRHAQVERVPPVGHRRLVQVEVAVVLDRLPGFPRVEQRLVAVTT
jgi:hypothetical protein